jgi:hypothetical protein
MKKAMMPKIDLFNAAAPLAIKSPARAARLSHNAARRAANQASAKSAAAQSAPQN